MQPLLYKILMSTSHFNHFFPIGCIVGAVCCLLMTTGCMERTSNVLDSLDADTVDLGSTDSIPLDSLSQMIAEAPMPKAADELFDDFLFNYAANIEVQRSRTIFPLVYEDNGLEVVIEKKGDWKREGFFMSDGYYTILCHDKKQLRLIGDTMVSEAVVQRLSFIDQEVKEWKFTRIKGKWCMRTIVVKDLSETPDYEFMQFYNDFATDTLNQEKYLAQYVTFKGPDPDEDFSTLEGDIMREQWPMFKPWLPKNVFYCIRYGKQQNVTSDKRYFLIRGISNGIQTDLVFIKRGDSWELVKVEA